MSGLVLAHVAAAVAALVAGPLAVRYPNGSPVHRLWGRVYVVGWVVLAVLGAVIGRERDGVSAFEVMNALGLLFVVASLAAIAGRVRIGPRWKRWHYRAMVVSYGFVMAASATQVLLRAGVGVPGWAFALLVAAPFAVLIPVRRRLDAVYAVGVRAAALVVLAAPAGAQESDAARRFSFAESYVGAAVASPVETAAVSGVVGEPGVTPAAQIAVGGLHFWGHADFYVRFGLPAPGSYVGDRAFENRATVETGARVYPLATRPGSVRPFVGASWTVEDVALGDGPTRAVHRLPVEAGLTARRGRMAVDAAVRYAPRADVDYPVSRTERGTVALPSWSATVGVRTFFETTAGHAASVASGRQADRERRMREAGTLSGWTVGLGPSSTIPLRDSPRNEGSFFVPRGDPAVFPELGVGYYHDGLDAFANLAVRRARVGQRAYGAEQRLTRTAATLEVAKALGDAHGFVPFVGVGASLERLAVTESDQGEGTFAASRTLVTPSVLVGWDIRPTRSERLILRTNLRYAPGLSAADGAVRFDQIEFNFIQAVWHLGR